MSASLSALYRLELDTLLLVRAGCHQPTARRHLRLCRTHLWDPQSGVDGQARAKAREGLDVGGGGQRPPALSVDGKGQRFEVLGVDMPVLSSHRLQEVLAGDNLWVQKTS